MVSAAAIHDNGWREWEDAPRLNPETRRPYTYIDIPIAQHLAIYRRGIARALVEDSYTGLLVSMHGSLLYSRFRQGQPGAADFLAEQRALRERLLDELCAEPRYAAHCDEHTITRNRNLLFGWDALSLFLCHGRAWEESLDFPRPGSSGSTTVAVRGDERRWRLNPFPFREPLHLSIATLDLDAVGFKDQAELNDALARGRRASREVIVAPAMPA